MHRIGKLAACTVFVVGTSVARSQQSAGAARLLFDFETPGAGQAWRSKSNTTVMRSPDTPKSGRGCLRFEIDPAEFAYGWVHRNIRPPLPGDAAGFHGWFRASRGATGKLMFYIVRGLPGEPTYYGIEIGRLSESEGEWTEFFVPWSALKRERGKAGPPTADGLDKSDLIQFLVSVGDRKPVRIDIDAIDAPSSQTAAVIRARVHRARLRRLLHPVPRASAHLVPHPRLLLTDACVAAVRERAKRNEQVRAVLDRYVENARRIANGSTDALSALRNFTENSKVTGTPWRATFEGRVRALCRTIEQPAAVWRFTGDPKLAQFARQQVVAATEYLTPAFRGFDRGFYYTRSFWVRTLAFAYDWLYPVLAPEQRRQLQAVILDFVLDIHEESQTGGWGRRPLHVSWPRPLIANRESRASPVMRVPRAGRLPTVHRWTSRKSTGPQTVG